LGKELNQGQCAKPYLASRKRRAKSDDRKTVRTEYGERRNEGIGHVQRGGNGGGGEWNGFAEEGKRTNLAYWQRVITSREEKAKTEGWTRWGGRKAHSLSKTELGNTSPETAHCKESIWRKNCVPGPGCKRNVPPEKGVRRCGN